LVALADEAALLPTVEAVALAVPATMPATAVSAGRASATIVGSSPMATGRLSAWARRTAAGFVDVSSWDVGEEATEHPLPDDVRASHEARTVIRRLVAGVPCFDDLLLAASELTANAVQHGGGARSMTMAVSPVSVGVGLTDLRPDRPPTVLGLDGVATSGRGMAIVDAISDHWGVTRFHDRKVVWCEFLLHAARSSAAKD